MLLVVWLHAESKTLHTCRQAANVTIANMAAKASGVSTSLLQWKVRFSSSEASQHHWSFPCLLRLGRQRMVLAFKVMIRLGTTSIPSRFRSVMNVWQRLDWPQL